MTPSRLVPATVPAERKRWYFTFGSSHCHPFGYVVVHDGTYSEARERMFARFGREWAFQYDDEHWHRDGISQAERYGLKEIPSE